MTRIARTLAAAPLSLMLILPSLAGSAAAQTQLFEVETSDARKLLRVGDDGGFVVNGLFGGGSIPEEGVGTRLMWYPKKAALRAGRVDAGQSDDGSVGLWSTELGQYSTASGTHSLAVGGDATASADRSVAMGGGTTASGQFALAMGQVSVASGFASTAIGERAVSSSRAATALGFSTAASGDFSTALGSGTTAAGVASVAMGSGVTAQGAGSFIFGDRSTGNVITAGENEFLVRAHGGIGFNSGVGIGCDLPAGTGAWACTSSRLAKEGFEDVDGETFLAKLAGIRIQRWRYIATEAEHVGPTAEDFSAAFGLGEGSTKIATVDADGVSLLAAQALERRTSALKAENASLRGELTALRRQVESLVAAQAEVSD